MGQWFLFSHWPKLPSPRGLPKACPVTPCHGRPAADSYASHQPEIGAVGRTQSCRGRTGSKGGEAGAGLRLLGLFAQPQQHEGVVCNGMFGLSIHHLQRHKWRYKNDTLHPTDYTSPHLCPLNRGQHQATSSTKGDSPFPYLSLCPHYPYPRECLHTLTLS